MLIMKERQLATIEDSEKPASRHYLSIITGGSDGGNTIETGDSGNN